MATVIQTKDLSTDVVQVGSVVHVKDEKTGKSVKYTIVGSAEAKPDEYKLSNESPVGRALLGHKRNDTVAVEGPARSRAQAQDHQDRRRPRVVWARVSAAIASAARRRPSVQARPARADRRASRQGRASARPTTPSAFPYTFSGRRADRRDPRSYAHLANGDETEDAHRVAGRLAARRGAGKAAFLDLVDRTGKIQLHARVDVLGKERFERLLSLDLGDLIGADGIRLRSRHGEVSLRLDDFQLLSKALRPPPDKHHGLADVETRYRHRELDLIASADARRLFVERARIISAVRAQLDGDGFVEVETPVLQPLYGGAMARPFTTHHNALDRDLYLRIATELYLKRLIVGGLERVYELGKDFRNEGVSHKHNPEFTMVECYEAYADYELEAERLEGSCAPPPHPSATTESSTSRGPGSGSPSSRRSLRRPAST